MKRSLLCDAHLKCSTVAGMIWVLLTISSSALLAQQPLRTISEVVFQPQRIATHGDGEILVTETRRNTVQRLAADGQPLESFQVEHPLAVGVDAQGRILIGHGTRVDAFDGPQIVYTLGRGEGEFGKPSDLVVLPDGRILVTDCSNHVVRSYSADGTALGVIGAPGSGNGEFQFPTGIAVNSQRGEVYVADQGNARIQVFDLSGAFLRAFGRFTCQGPDGWVFEGTFTRIQGIAVDAANRIYVADSYQNNIQILSATGAFLGFLDLDDQGRHLFSLPCDLAVAGNNLFVVSTASSEISVFALDGLAADPDADTPETVESYFLSQNYPNPFNPETHIRFSLPVAGHVTLTILDVLGREVVRLVDGARAAGNHTVTWNGYSASGSAASSGVYFCQLRVTNGAGTIAHSSQRKMVLLK